MRILTASLSCMSSVCKVCSRHDHGNNKGRSDGDEVACCKPNIALWCNQCNQLASPRFWGANFRMRQAAGRVPKNEDILRKSWRGWPHISRPNAQLRGHGSLGIEFRLPREALLFSFLWFPLKQVKPLCALLGLSGLDLLSSVRSFRCESL